MDNSFFVLSKLAWALLSPSNLILILFAVGTLFLLFNRTHIAKWLLLPTSVIALSIMSYPTADWLMQPLESRFAQPQQLPEKIDGIIVLGGGEDIIRSASWNVAELGQGGDRFIAASKLSIDYPKTNIIYAGGNSSVQKEGMQNQLNIEQQIFSAMGVNLERVIIEKQAHNTYENFVNIKPLLPKTADDKLGTYLLVTSAFHMPRSVGIARKQGINVIPYPVDYRSSSAEQRVWGLDFYDHLQVLEPAWKEWIGLVVYFLTDKTSSLFPGPLPHDASLEIHPNNDTFYQESEKTIQNKTAAK
ncbi:hypothetical protein THMIRHAS_20680 [Thiosulfatimonas sediminis]|uniref:DUF218 domain-containing protein n=1 Tax=Thiosulfatimonas sediminis TaxID=2675054 RepID=A0A6F8PX43_9GAMM|nr:YdcF family protein [Thiosulfatimonas sediminis]BBP46695.1 hypothetical protein THMIRHAS_20680 [Thiosulfatimonas sediminis]